ncbi:MAG: FAD-dependent oxidoreductase [Methylomarinum sp.]|nr:FAD-dependent oxidoreductase [Methylomarinum sp.]
MKKIDVIIVGTGMGGATTGYALAKAGLKVLFIEKGLSDNKTNSKLTGEFFETYGFKKPAKQRHLIQKQSGREYSAIKDTSSLLPKKFTPFTGAGTGGGSALYGAILERFKAEDFTPGQFYSKTPESISVPEKWPVSFQEFEPYYQQAEQLYAVRKPDSTQSSSSPSNISTANKKAWEQLTENNFHPYILPTATENIESCKDNCQSFLCAHQCKNDSSKCALKPAIEKYQAELIDNCEVLEIISQQGKVTELRCQHGDEILQLKADMFILASGALTTPALLLKSNNLANSSGLVGKYLMRHYIDLFAIKLKGINVFTESQKQIGFNDFYNTEQGKFGTVQSFGLMPPIEVVIEELTGSLPFGLNKPALWGMNNFAPIMNYFYQYYFQNKLIFASIMEDLPNRNNAINFKKGQIEFSYTLPTTEKQRIKELRKQVINAFSPLPITVLKQADNNQRLAHACGTCRFGDDPTSAVLNRFNKTHDIDNLYITDASFFPTSGGINPSLTIAANALRVADSIIKGE